ncbi:MAG: hypothetical protein JXB29_09355 [Sedimentisphaerales bacterium]|nr:hypothetical protein [Sedimentisphaerales bacterium]
MCTFVLYITAGVLGSNGQDNGWTQLLVLVMLAVVYGLGGLLKARSRKAAEKEQEQPTSKAGKDAEPAVQGWGKAQYHKVQQKSASLGPKVRGRVQIYPKQRKVSRPKAAIHKPTFEPTKPSFVQPLGLEEIKAPEVTVDFEELSKIDAGGERKGAKSGLSELVLDYPGYDTLQMAILHYEILGKPLSLREPSDALKCF